MTTESDETQPSDDSVGGGDADHDDVAVPGPAARRTVPLGAFVAAILVALALGTLAVVALAGGEDGTGSESEGRAATDARLAAARFADRFLTYAYDDMGSWREEVAALSTGGFAQEVGEMEASLTELLTSGEIRARSQIAEVYLGSIEGSSVSIVVRFDRLITDTRGERLETNGYTRFDMVDTEAGWLVEDVFSLADPSPITSSSEPDGGSDSESPPEAETDDE